MMKTRKLHLIILIALAALFCGNDHVLAQEKGTNYNIDLRNGRVRFTVYKQVWYSDSPGHEISIDHNDANTYTITSGGEPTTYRINIETKNLYAAATNPGCTYNIILDNVIIDRRSVDEHNIPKDEPNGYLGLGSGVSGGLLEDPDGSGPGGKVANSIQHQYYHQYYACFDAGDGTVDVNVYLKGHNEIRSGEGVFAALQYLKWCSAAQAGSATGFIGDTAATFNDGYREGKLRFLNGSGDDKNPGTLLVTKEIYVNSGAAIGGAMTGDQGRSGNLVFESGNVTAQTGDPRITYRLLDETHTTYNKDWPLLNSTFSYGAYGAAIGGGGCSRCGNITINGGTVTARSSATAAAIGGGGGQHGKGSAAGRIEINGGTVNAYCRGNGLAHDTGVGIGGGSGLFNGGADAKEIIITGGTITAYKWHYTDLDHFYDTLNADVSQRSHWEPDGHIGGGHSNGAGWAYGTVSYGYRGDGGNANITITGGNITAGSIGGGIATRGIVDSTNPDDHGSVGGNVNLTINMTSGSVNVSGKIGGGNSWAGNGGSANITIVKGTVTAGSIGGGDSTNDGNGREPTNYELPPGTYYVPGQGYVTLPDNTVSIPATVCDGGDATVNVSGGLLTMTGKIGGGSSAGSGNGGNASVIITGGELDCASIGGGDSKTGTPGSVISGSGAGVQISEANPAVLTTLKTGFIGGGKNTEGTVGYATATMSGGSVQGQFVLTNSGSNHSYFTMSGGTIDNTNLGDIGAAAYPRLRENGGAVSMADTGGNVTITGGTIQNCTGSTNGGAIYTNGAVSFSNGTIQNNGATADGGAIYIASGGSITISGTAEIINNNVESGNGGGIYVGGTITANGTSLVVNNNTKGSAGKAQTANNVYLPSGKEINAGTSLSPNVYMGITTENTATASTKIPVLNGTEAKLTEIYAAMHSGTSKIRDDRGIHYPYYNSAQDVDDLYFALIEFDYPAFTTDFSGDIDSPEQLYKFMCWVNGVNGFGTAHPNATGNVTADIDMSGFVKLWIPIGEDNVVGSTSPYTGTFNGNGHNLKGLAMTKADYLYVNYGLFGTTEGAKIHDVFVTDCNFNKTGAGTMGCVVGHMKGGSLSNCEGAGTLITTNLSCISGGLAGKVEKDGDDAATIHSSCGMPLITGYQMGGLVGDLASGCNLFNSFAGLRLTGQSGNDKYVGGLVGVNNGRVENCYVRMGGATPTGKFGYLAGTNTTASEQGLYYCYVYESYSPIVSTSGTSGNQVGLGTYSETEMPYTYKHRDTQVTVTVGSNSYVSNVTGADNQLLIVLNKWVSAKNTDLGASTYTPWLRAMQRENDKKYINSDFPILRMPDVNAVAGVSDNYTLYYGDINSLLSGYTASTNNILFYGKKAGMSSNYSSSATLYIDENAVLTQSGSKAAGDIVATVGITLDNSAGTAGANPTWGGGDAIDWHMFSTSLVAAPLGVEYVKNDLTTPDNNQYLFSWGQPQTAGGVPMPYYRFYQEGDANHGYFPSHTYGESYPSGNANLTNGNYYEDWDFYCYYEPDAHWINFKRNGNSHWHEDSPDGTNHAHIDYKAKPGATANQNETHLIQGKGYLLATKEPTYLQCSGTLTNGTVSYTVTANGWQRTGYNLLGNPYQSYLDFEAFARKNKALWGITDEDYSAAFYFILDEDQRGYIKYAYGATPNAYTAPMYLHPHQGFMVIAESGMNIEFNESMRSMTATGVTFRDGEGARPAYALVNLIATEENGNRDVCTVELGRPDKGGAPMQRGMRVCKGLVYCHYDDRDWAIAFTQPGLSEAAIRFETSEDAVYTMTWDTENGDFSYLHLIDNMTGSDIDCLTATEYRFAASPSDYASRFRLVFGYTGIEEPGEDGLSTGSGTFAFQMGDELVVNGEGTLQMFDVTGRQVMQAATHGVQTTVAIPAVSAGVYVLRLTGKTNGTQTQKIVIQ